METSLPARNKAIQDESGAWILLRCRNCFLTKQTASALICITGD